MRCKDCGGEVVPYNHPVAPESFPPFVCASCGRFYMRSEAEALGTGTSPQTGAHSPVEPSWQEWEPGHEGKALVTDNGHVYSWSNGNHRPLRGEKPLPNGPYMPHGLFMKKHLGIDDAHNYLNKWHFFEIDPNGDVFRDSSSSNPGYTNALQRLRDYHPALSVDETDWNFR